MKNNPNLMPSKYMLLYGADDANLEKEGNLNDHPDLFDNGQEHKISVKNLRAALRLMGHEDVEEDGPFDVTLYCAYFRYLWQHGRVNIGGLYDYDENEEHTFEEDAEKYGVFSWKYFNDHAEAGESADHDTVVDELSPKFGDEELSKKGVAPRDYKPGVSYHYPRIPFDMDVGLPEELSDKGYKIKIFVRKTMKCVEEGELVDD